MHIYIHTYIHTIRWVTLTLTLTLMSLTFVGLQDHEGALLLRLQHGQRIGVEVGGD